MKEKKYLILIEKSNPLFPVAEKLAKHKGCEYVDSITSELIDAIGKFKGSKGLDEIKKEFGFSEERIKEIKAEILGERKKGRIPFWLRVYVKGNGDLVKNLEKTKDWEEIYLTSDNSLFLRSCADSLKKICKLEDETLDYLRDWLDLEKRTTTYFVLKRFSANS